VIVDAAAEHPVLFFNQEGAVEQNLATCAASAALTAASASDGGTILVRQHRPHDGTSDLSSQLNQHFGGPAWSRRTADLRAKMLPKVADESARD
jgi:hypothetical protein